MGKREGERGGRREKTSLTRMGTLNMNETKSGNQKILEVE